MASGETLFRFTPWCSEPASANAGTLDIRNQHPVLNMALNELAVFSDTVQRNYDGGGITVYIHYAMASATTNDVNLETYFERIGDQQQDLDSDGFAAAQNTGDITVPGTSGLVDIVTTTHTDGGQIDSIAVGEGFRLKIKRAAVAGTDAAGDLQLVFVEGKET